MLAKSLYLALLPAIALVGATPLSPRDNSTCWVGDIHSPCNGSGTGCTSYGWLLRCDGNSTTGSMVFSSTCGDSSGEGDGCIYLVLRRYAIQTGGLGWKGLKVGDCKNLPYWIYTFH
ncbi:hypothetical protein B0T17DRAFT_235386 [Bombardia bombarda]|uniref:Uncharacterized protein n=1 Tax=Bombardia bombarda TaxID=252184 RepID=A0AA39XC42_9PEZI|nr:hypothetical protein B0T17DRAFT_235386 [Bombardia bombarda]